MATKTILTALAMGLAVPALLHAQRKPLFVEPLTRIAHDPTGIRLRYDSVRNEYVRYPVDGRIEFRPQASNSWNRADGTREEMIWEPRNKLTAIVAAEVSLDRDTDRYTYSYTVTNLPSSAQALEDLFSTSRGRCSTRWRDPTIPGTRGD